MPPIPDSEIERVLIVMAHPDDVDFSCAGAVAGWTAAGIDVRYVIATDGDAGGYDPAVDRAEIAGIRQAEQRAAAGVVGVTDVTFLGYRDGRVTASLELRRDIAREVRRARPQRVICPSPERQWQRIGISHPDHLATGEATLCAVYPDARNPFAYPELLSEGFEAWSAAEVWMIGGPQPDHAVDVTDTADAKLAAIRAHVSQLPDSGAIEERIRGFLAMNAQLAGLPEGRLAERFQVVPTA